MSTLWTDFLLQQGAILEADSVRFDSAPPAPSATAVIPLAHLGLIQSTGVDSASFLHTLLSNDVTHLPADAVQWSSLNTPKGRMLANLLLWASAEGHLLALSNDILPAVLKKLSMYILRSKVKLACTNTDTVLIGVCGPDTGRIIGQTGLSFPQSMRHNHTTTTTVLALNDTMAILVVPAADAPSHYSTLRNAGAVQGGSPVWETAMIRAGLPNITAATQEEFVAQMLNFDLIGGVSFKKGCYPGQEIVARTQYLGKLKKRLYRLGGPATTCPAPGTDLYAPDFGDQSAGKIVNAALTDQNRFEALAVIQRSATGGPLHLGAPDGPELNLLDLPYALPTEN